MISGDYNLLIQEMNDELDNYNNYKKRLFNTLLESCKDSIIAAKWWIFLSSCGIIIALSGLCIPLHAATTSSISGAIMSGLCCSFNIGRLISCKKEYARLISELMTGL